MTLGTCARLSIPPDTPPGIPPGTAPVIPESVHWVLILVPVEQRVGLV